MHIAILGLGPSVRQYMELTKRAGGRSAFCTETWGINALGDVFACDRIFHMDDVRIQEIRAAAKPDSNIARMLDEVAGVPEIGAARIDVLERSVFENRTRAVRFHKLRAPQVSASKVRLREVGARCVSARQHGS